MNQKNDARQYLMRQNLLLIEQGLQVIGMISADDYVRVPDMAIVEKGSPGCHFRHVANFYEQLFSPERYSVNYGNRSRDSNIERSREAAEVLFIRLRKELARCLESAASCPAIQSICINGEAEAQYTIETCLNRELLAVAAHSIHHYAHISFILRGWNYEPPRNFGVAPDTPASDTPARDTAENDTLARVVSG
ncbi:MAG: hypothetical protein ACR2PY_01790 [Salinispira sp.]